MPWNLHYFSLRTVQSLFFYLTKQWILLSTIDILLIEVNLAHARATRIKVSWVGAFVEETFLNFLPWSSLCGLCGFISCPHALLAKHAGLSVTNDIARYDGNWFHCMWIKTSSKWCLKIYGQIILLLLVTEGKGKYKYMKLNQSPSGIYVFPVFFPGFKLFLSLNLFIWKSVWFLLEKWLFLFFSSASSFHCMLLLLQLEFYQTTSACKSIFFCVCEMLIRLSMSLAVEVWWKSGAAMLSYGCT